MSTAIARNLQVGTSGTATDNFTIFQPATPDGTLRIGNGNTGITTSLLTLTSAGNVGIGTSTPSVRMQVTGGSTGTLAVQSTGTAGSYPSSGAGIEFVAGSAADTDAILSYNRTASSWRTLNIQTGTTIFSTVGSERMRIDSSGNVGIGTSTPNGQITFNLGAGNSGSLKTYDQNDLSGLSTYMLGDGTRIMDLHSNGAPNGAAGGSIMRFMTTGIGFGTFTTERARIDSSGNLLVGTTSASNSRLISVAPSTVIAVHAFSGAAGDEGTEAARFSKTSATTTTSQVFARFTTSANSVAMGQINANGLNQVAFGSWSDARMKENIQALPSQLANICALRPVEFDYINGEGDKHQTGFIAQEMREVYPDSVGEDSEGMLTITGWNKTEARLVKAIQELKAEFDAYKATHP